MPARRAKAPPSGFDPFDSQTAPHQMGESTRCVVMWMHAVEGEKRARPTRERVDHEQRRSAGPHYTCDFVQRTFRIPHMIERVEADGVINRPVRERQHFGHGGNRQLAPGKGHPLAVLGQQRIDSNPLRGGIGKMNQAERPAADVQHAAPAEAIHAHSKMRQFILPVPGNVEVAIGRQFCPVLPEIQFEALRRAPARFGHGDWLVPDHVIAFNYEACEVSRASPARRAGLG